MINNKKTARFHEDIFELIPHRPPMLLINQIVMLDDKSAKAMVVIDQQTPFFEHGLGIPSWIGLEYMGQAAALIAGYQQKKGLIKDQLGFLLGSRHYKTEVEYFSPSAKLLVRCIEVALVGDSLATFDCKIQDTQNNKILAQANLSVLRKMPT